MVLADCRPLVGEATYHGWLATSTLLHLTEDGVACLGVPTAYHTHWLTRWATESAIKAAFKHHGHLVKRFVFEVIEKGMAAA